MVRGGDGVRRAGPALAALLLPVAALAQPAQVGFGETDTLAHRLAGEDVVESEQALPLGRIRVRVTVPPTGEVIDAKLLPDNDPDELSSADSAAAIAAAKRWRFEPFTYRGTPVTALGEITLHYRSRPMAGEWKKPGEPFPAVDYGSLRITLIRDGFYGGTPHYSVTIDGDGSVTFTTDAPASRESDWPRDGGGVVAPGTRRSRTTRAVLDALIERFRAVRFFRLRPHYVGGRSHASTQTLRFESGGARFELSDYAGELDGMPAAVSALERAIDEAALSARWVKGDAETARLALAEGLDINGAAARTMALSSVRLGDGQVATDLIEAGLPLETIVGSRDGETPLALGVALLLSAAEHARPGLFARLADAGWLARAPRDRLADILVRRGAVCEPDLARRIVGAGIGVDSTLPARPGWPDARGGTALTVASRWCEAAGRDPLPQVAMLLALGADPNRPDSEGRTPIFHAARLDVIEQLLAAGARADIKDAEGRSPVFSAYSDAPVRRLLDAGADPGSTDRHGRSLRQIATEGDWPATLEWLDAKGVP